jgi:septal ring factor EnvC (AmiA/AmiB activator)
MSLTLEDLKAISDLIDVKLDKQEQNINKRFDQVDKKFEQVDKKFEQIDKRFEQIDKRFEQIDKRFEQIDKRFDEQDKRFDKKLDEFRNEFKEMLIDNNVLIAEHVQRVVSESEDRLSKQIHDIRNVVAQNSYDIAGLKRRTS